MSAKTIQVFDETPRAGTFFIAKGFNREHKTVAKLIERYREDFEDFGTLKVRKIKTKGRPVIEFWLNEQQALLLGTYMRNNKIVREFKKKLIRQFEKLRVQNEALKKHKQQPQYTQIRNTGKLTRLETTDIIQKFVEYSQKQGSKHADYYYSNITRMVNGLLFIVEGKFKNLREVMTTQQLMTISSAEQIINKGLSEGMKSKMFYKDIYKLIKGRVFQFAELHGKSEVIDHYLQIEG